MKCPVPGCDTDDNVVSYTSVFFVKFPDDTFVQNQWIAMLGTSDANLVNALLIGEVKLCSCHFTEDCFGQHPIYGYRYLLPEALPTILPPPIAELLPPSFDLVDETEADPNYYFIYDDSIPASSSEAIKDVEVDEGVEEEQDVEEEHDVEEEQEAEDEVEAEEHEQADAEEPVNDGNKLEVISEENSLEGLEMIGIKVVEGKVYFIRLNDDSDEESDLPDTAPALEAIHERTPNERTESWEGLALGGYETPELANIEVPCVEEPCVEETQHEKADAADESLQTVEFFDETFVEPDDDCHQDLIGYDSDVEQLDEYDEDIIAEVDSAEVIALPPVEPVDSTPAVYTADNVNVDSVDHLEDELFPTEDFLDGTIEALDEVSVHDGEVCVRNTEEENKPHVCDVCGKAFRYPSGLAKHDLTHSKLKPYSCEHCPQSFSQKANLNIHMRRHTGNRPEGRFVCEVCGKKCSRQSELRAHLGIHRKQYPILCPVCDSRFVNVTQLYTHLRQEHKDCDITMDQVLEKFIESSKPVVITDKLYRKEREVPGPDGRYECGMCEQRFVHLRTLRRHNRKMHPKVFYCQYCQRSFPYRSMLEKHLTVHTFEKQFRCPHCSNRFSQRCNLNKHIQSKHCGMVLLAGRYDEDAEHALVEDTRDGVSKSFDCPHCSKSFFRKMTWLAHIDSHNTGDDVHPACEYCGMAFASRDSLRTHRRRMHCGVLDKLTPDKLRIHARSVWHENIDEMNNLSMED